MDLHLNLNQIHSSLDMEMINKFANLLNQDNPSKSIRINSQLPNLSNDYKNCLVLLIISPRTFQIYGVRELLHKTWKTFSQKFFVSEFTSETFLIRFESHAESEFIMESSPWVVREDLLDWKDVYQTNCLMNISLIR